MRFDPAVVAAVLALLVDPCSAFQGQVGRESIYGTPSSSAFPISLKGSSGYSKKGPTSGVARGSASTFSVALDSTEVDEDVTTKLTHDIISKLRFREVQRELERRELDTSGTFTDMRQRLRLLVPDKTEKEQPYETGTNAHVIGEDALNAVSTVQLLDQYPDVDNQNICAVNMILKCSATFK